MANENPTNGELLDANPTNEPSLDEIINGTVNKFRADTDIAVLGRSTDFAAPDLDRYISYGSDTFGKLGYKPGRDNSSVYNDNTHWSADLSRAYTGMQDLAGIGRADTFAFGLFSSDDSHKDFDKIMQDYGSTRGGAAGFVSNTMLSAGYTKGIIEAIAVEEALLLVTTGGLGNIATAGEIGRAGGKIYQAWGSVGKASKFKNVLGGLDKGSKATRVFPTGRVGNSINFMKNIENARLVKDPFLMRTLKKTGEGLKTWGKNLIPGGDLVHFLKNIDDMPMLNKYQKAFTGAASLARDSRKIHMAMAESNLEANLASEEVRDRLYDEWYSSHVGEEMDSEARNDIESKTKDIHNITYNANFGLIYATNAITFGTMFRSMRYTNKAFGISQSRKFAAKGLGTKEASVKAIKKGLGSWAKNKVEGITFKNASMWALKASIEGDQELGQDLIAGFAKRYVAGDEKLRGSFYNSMLAGMSDMHAESFFSGMLMGTFAAPTSIAIREANNFFLHGGHEAITKRAAWKESRSADYSSRQKDAKILTDYFNATNSFLDASSQNLFTQSKAQSKMAEAGENNDRKAFEDARAEAQRLGLETLMKHGLESEYIDHLTGLKKHTAEELNESLQRNDITEENIGKFQEKIDNKIKEVKEFKKIYKEVHEMVNPIDINKLKKEDPEFEAKRMTYLKFEYLRKEMLYSRDAIRNLTSRLSSLDSQIQKEGIISSFELKTMLDIKALGQQVNLLSAELSADKEYDTNADERVAKERKLKALKSYQAALVKFDNLKEGESAKKVRSEMFAAYNEIANANLNVEGDPGQKVLNQESFEKVWDYLVNTNERNNLQKHANMLLDPEIAMKFMDQTEKILKDIDKNKEAYILKSLNAFHENSVAQEMMDDLVEAGYVFSYEEIDDLIKRKIMPTKLYNHKTNKELTSAEFKEAQVIIDRHTRRLKGKRVLSSKDTAYVTRKKDEGDNRSAKGLYRQFSKRKKDTPISIADFINSLLESPYITNSEKEILTVLKDLKVAEGNIVLTESAEAPITIGEDGTVTVDVRFSASDFINEGTPFEYLAVSALLQAHYSEQLKSSPELKAKTVSLMKKAREAYIVRQKNQTKADVALFTDPVTFLSEALNNEPFQNFLASVEDVEEAGENSLWKSFMNLLKETYGKLFKGSLLNRAVQLSQLALTDEQIEVTLEQEEESELEEVKEAIVNASAKERLESEISKTKVEISTLEAEKSSPRRYFKKNSEVKRLRVKLSNLEMELEALPEETDRLDKKVPSHKAENKSVEELDSDGDVIIKDTTPFRSLDIKLQETLAGIFWNSVDHTSVKEKGDTTKEKPKDAITESQGDFDKGTNLPALPEKYLDRLDDKHIKKIEELMQSNSTYQDAIGDYNAKRLHVQEPVQNAEPSMNDKIDAARNGDVDAIAELEEYGLPYHAHRIYRFVSKGEVDALVEGTIVEGKNKNVGVDVTSSETPTTASNVEYRVRFKDSFDFHKDGGMARLKNENLGDGWVEDGYDLSDVDVIEQQNEDGTYTVVYSQEDGVIDIEPTDMSYTTADLVEIVEDILDIYPKESDITEILRMYNADEISPEKIVIAAAERRALRAKENFELYKDTWLANDKFLNSIAGTGVKFIVTEGDKRSQITISKENVLLFRQQHNGAVKLSKEDFRFTFNAFVLTTKAKAKTIRNSELPFSNDENIKENLKDFLRGIESSKAMSTGVVNAINNKLKAMGSTYKVKNIARRNMKGLELTYGVVEEKDILKRDISKKDDLSDYYSHSLTYGPKTIGEVWYMIYDWLKTNKVHPDAIPVGEKRWYTKSDSEYVSFDGISDEIFNNAGFGVEAENLGAKNIVEEILKDFDRVSDLRAHVEGMMNREVESGKTGKDYSDEEAYEKHMKEQVELSLHEFYKSEAWSNELQKQYDTENIPEAQVTPVQGEVLVIEDSFKDLAYEKSQKRYVKQMLDLINKDVISTQELIGIHRAALQFKGVLTPVQSDKIMNAIHSRIIEMDVQDKQVIVGEERMLITSDSTQDTLVFMNMDTKVETPYPIHEALSMIDEVLEDGTIYNKSDTDTTITSEDSGILKQAYSEIFANFTESVDKIKDMEPEVLKASIIEELNKCK